MTVYERIKAIAKERGLPLYELEKKAGIAQNGIYKWDARMPSMRNLQKVADALNMPVEELMHDEIDMDIKNALDREEVQVLLKASAKLNKSDIEFLTQMCERMSNELRSEE